ncbi:winged helix-turn-helix domain-containing protein [Streptomyces sp. NPDC057611]|uniref:winged helix-turn-helix domain-containing protein n=1 Tax=Streptomyces sp. NPDC057611 TaxID=3346182 RepID=UPI0036AA36F6
MAEASPRGTYLVIAEVLRKEIKKGEPLLSEAALMRSHNVARNTIRRALKVLEADGVVEFVPGTGWRPARDGGRRSLADASSTFHGGNSTADGDHQKAGPWLPVWLPAPR